MTASRFDSDRWSLEAARGLPVDCFDDFQRLSRTLIHGPIFQWLLVDASDERLRKRVMAALNQVLSAAKMRSSRLPVGRRIADVSALEARLIEHAKQSDVVHVIVPHAWFDAARWDAFNVRRERIAAQARARLVFWLDAEAIAAASRGAPDLWAWRSGVYAFVSAPALLDDNTGLSRPEALAMGGAAGIDTRSMAERHRRIAEIRAWLDAHPDANDEMLIAPFHELGWLYYSLGDYDDALAHWRGRELPLHRRRGDDRAVAVTQSHIADILQMRGELGEALRIRSEEELPVYKRLGDVRELAILQSRIADIVQARGELDEALRLRREEVLPAFQKLGDPGLCAVEMGRIADIFQARGDLEEALRIRRDEELPVYDQTGDVRERAIVLAKIADILTERGELEEALRIVRDVALVFERLGDVRGRAITQGKIADILQARGESDEALRIRREELSVYERLGDVRERAITLNKIADTLKSQGDIENALKIYRQDVLPAYEQLENAHLTLIGRANLASTLAKRGHSEDLPEIRTLLVQALVEAERLRLPEAKAIRGLIAQIFGDGGDSASLS